MEIQDLKEALRENGVVGAGGAGFPTYAKLDSRAEIILMNCAGSFWSSGRKRFCGHLTELPGRQEPGKPLSALKENTKRP